MGIVQQSSGTFNGTSFTVSLPSASSASNLVVVLVAANTTVTTPSGFTLRTSQVNYMGHYLWDRAGGASSWAFTNSAGQGIWWVAEIAAGVFDGALGQNDIASATSYTTPALTPTAGTRTLIASFGSLANPAVARTVSGWTNAFIEQLDTCSTVSGSADPLHAVATLDVTASGSTAYSTGVTFSSSSEGRSALIASYATTSGGASDAGVLAASLPKVTGTIAGTAQNAAALAAALPLVVGSITGTLTNPGVLAASVPLTTAALSGASTNPGSASAAVPLLTATITGTATNPGTLAASVPRVTGSISDQSTNTGTLTASLPRPTGALTGTSTNPGTVSGALRMLVAVITGGSTNPASIAAVLPLPAAALSGTSTNTGALTGVLPAIAGRLLDASIPPLPPFGQLIPRALAVSLTPHVQHLELKPALPLLELHPAPAAPPRPHTLGVRMNANVWEGDTRPVIFDLTADGAPIDTAGVTAHRLVATSTDTRTPIDLPNTLTAGAITWTRSVPLPVGSYTVVAELTDASGVQTYPSADSDPVMLTVMGDPAP